MNLFCGYTLNSLSISRIHFDLPMNSLWNHYLWSNYEVTIFFAKLLWIHYLFSRIQYKLTWCFANILWIHLVFRIHYLSLIRFFSRIHFLAQIHYFLVGIIENTLFAPNSDSHEISSIDRGGRTGGKAREQIFHRK